MKSLRTFTTAFLLSAGFFVGSLGHQTAWAEDMDEHEKRYSVTFTNTSRGQLITPPVILSHTDAFRLFTIGSPAGEELAALAEDGESSALLGFLATQPEVLDVAVATSPLPPGESLTLEISVQGRNRRITAVGMLATTNDTFFALRGAKAPRHGSATVQAVAYDAGTEANNESCAVIPGPPCGHPNVRATDGAEGFVHVSAGIHGTADLDPSVHDWRNPVVEITLRKMN